MRHLVLKAPVRIRGRMFENGPRGNFLAREWRKVGHRLFMGRRLVDLVKVWGGNRNN